MALLRLKSYTQEIFNKYLNLADEPTEVEKSATLGKRLRSSFTQTCQTVLFFNQSMPEMSFLEWCDRTPVTYLAEVDNFVGLLEDSARWAISAPGASQLEPEALREKLLVNMESYRISTLPERDNDLITNQFQKTWQLVYAEVPDNLRKRKSLIRLVHSYLCAKELTAMARELSQCDRVDYLRKLTKY
ncbi:MAG TPA: hypothetical protein V6C91_00230 [Coleofasciculaceae cyanobacterium]